MKLLAGRVAQLMNYQSLASDVGVDAVRVLVYGVGNYC